nr:hypothetical protein TetV2_00502 [Oceanusvirus sp.]
MRPVTALESTVILSSVVLGVELFLLIAYIRVQVLNGIKRQVYKRAAKEIDDLEITDSEPVDRPRLEDLHSAVCIRAYENSSILAVLGYALSTIFVVYLLSGVGKGEGGGLARHNTQTMVAAMFLSLVVFLGSQWGFFKLAVLPFYADVYTRFTGIDIPQFESDSLSLTLSLLSLTIVALLGFLVTGVAGFFRISWGVVLIEGLVSVLSLGTEVVSWVLMQGFAVPVSETVSAVADCTTAVLWVNENNSPDEAKAQISRVLFPNGERRITVFNIFSHFVHDNIDRKKLVLGENGGLDIVPSDERFLWVNIAMFSCVVVLFLAPIFVIWTRTARAETIIFAIQVAFIICSYGLYIKLSDKSATMQKVLQMY